MSERVDRQGLITAIDQLHKGAKSMYWAEADDLARALGWDLDSEPDGPDGEWLRVALREALQ